MWLLSIRPDHAGGCSARTDTQPERSGHRPCHGRQHLPVRNLPAHPGGHQGGGEGASMNAIDNVSRRHFLGGVFSTGAFVLTARILPESVWAQEPSFRTRADAAALHPSVYLGIEPDGTVFIVTHRSEMGTGIRTT